jgi:hypothetical protein
MATGTGTGSGTSDAPERWVDGLGLLVEATGVLCEPWKPSELGSSILPLLAAVAGTEHAFVCVTDPESGLLVVRAGLGVFSSLIGAVWSEGTGRSGGGRFPDQKARVTGRTALSRRRPELFRLGVRSLIEAPLGAAGLGGVIGAGWLNAGARFAGRHAEPLRPANPRPVPRIDRPTPITAQQPTDLRTPTRPRHLHQRTGSANPREQRQAEPSSRGRERTAGCSNHNRDRTRRD